MEIWGDRLNLKSCPTIFDERLQNRHDYGVTVDKYQAYLSRVV